MSYDPPFLPPVPRLAKGNNRADRVRITSDRSHLKFLLDTPDSYIGHAGEILVLDDNEEVFIFGDGSTLNIRAENVIIDPPILGLDSTNVYDAFIEILTLSGSDDQTASEVPIDPIPGLTPPASEVQTALEVLTSQTPTINNSQLILPSDNDIVDSHTPTTYTTYDWIITIQDIVSNEYRSSKVFGVYDGSTITHQVYCDIGNKTVKRKIHLQLNSGVVELKVENISLNTQKVKISRYPIIET